MFVIWEEYEFFICKNRSDSLVWDSERVTGVRSCYDEGKRTAETLTMDYHRGAGVEVSAHMLFCMYVYISMYIYILYDVR
jgi:nucleoside-diphosphate-sugar epimerase